MTTETFSEALKRLRSARGYSLRDLGQIVNYSRQYIHDLETGRRRVHPDLALALDHALTADGHLIRLTEAQGNESRVSPSAVALPGGTFRRADAETLAATLVAEPPRADNALQLAHQWLVTDPPQQYELLAGRRINSNLVEQIEKRVHQIRLLDDHIGGQDSRAVASNEIEATASLLREASYNEATGKRLLAAVGELCQIAGWITSDAGKFEAARQLYLAGARAAHAAGDAPGAASNLSSLAYQMANVGDPSEAVLLARSAYQGAKTQASAGTRALLLERVAWAHARAGEPDAAAQALDRVDEAYEDRQPDTDPLWVYWLSPEEIEVMAGRVWTQLHRPLRAVPALEHAIREYGPDAPREVALYLTWLAESLIQGGEIDRAVAVAQQAAQLAQEVRSSRVAQRVAEVQRLLQPYGKQLANP
jgi:transcriptional regulator with XRE-family HTH domain